MSRYTGTARTKPWRTAGADDGGNLMGAALIVLIILGALVGLVPWAVAFVAVLAIVSRM